MNYIDEERKPDVFGPGSVLLAALLHALFFGVLYFGGQFSFREDKVIIPIDLTVVMQENLDGDENEPPPVPDVKPPEPEPEPPKPPEPNPPEPKPPEPEPPKPVDPPPAVEHDPPVKTNEVAEVKPPEPPKKTAADLRAERLAAMVARTTKLPDMPKPPKPRATNGKTGPNTLSDEEIAKLLALGYKPGTEEVIATDEMTRCVSLVKMALEEKQDLLHPEMGAEGKVHLTIRFDRTGRVRNPSLTQSCGDAKTDAAALRIVRSLDTIRGLSSAFLDEFSKNPLTIEYTMSKRR